eukprot:9493527-Pyramimonas_sp.AAC.1
MWVLPGAALTALGAWAKHLEAVPMESEAEKSDLLKHPEDGKRLPAFIASEIQRQRGVLAAKVPKTTPTTASAKS